jgi:hypothetical protein
MGFAPLKPCLDARLRAAQAGHGEWRGLCLLTNSAQVYVNNERKTFKLYKAGGAENHPVSDDETLRRQLQMALNLRRRGRRTRVTECLG